MKHLVAVSILILLFLSVFVFPLSQPGSSVFYISLAFVAVSLFLSSWSTSVKRGLAYLRLAPKWKDAPSLALQSLMIFFACAAVTMAITCVFLLAGLLDTENVYDKVMLLPLPALVLACTLAPLGEEMLFRGFLFRKLSDWLGVGKKGALPWVAGAVLSSLLFAVMHAAYGSYAELAVTFAVGIALCIGVKKTNSLVPAVLAHAAFNFVSIFMAVFL